MIQVPSQYDKCPRCGKSFNAVLGPQSSLGSPDSGEWCFKYGCLFIHQELRYDHD